MSQSDLRALLAVILTPDTAKVKDATAKLKRDYYANPKSLELLLQILISDDSVEIRQLAAVEARKLVSRHWEKIEKAHQNAIRSGLLDATRNETTKPVRHAMSRLIGSIATKDLANGEWKGLPNQLIEGSTNSDPQTREVSTYILFSILDAVDDPTFFDYNKMFRAFSKTIQDRENPDVPMNTIFALSKIAMEIDTDSDEQAMATFRQYIPKMIEVLQYWIENKDGDRTTQTFECFQTLLEAKPKILDEHFRQLVQGMAGIAANEGIDEDTRTQALNFLLSCVLGRKLKFQSMRIGEEMVKMLFGILSHAEVAAKTSEDESDIATASLHLLSLMSSELPPPQVAGPTVVLFKRYAGSSELHERRAAVSMLATIVEGATDFVSTQMPELLPSILHLLKDSSETVREASVLAVRDIAEALPEVLAKQHEAFLAALAMNLQAAMAGIEGENADRNQRVVSDCCLAIDGLVTGLSAKQVQTYMPELVPNFTRLFSHPNENIKKSAISAVGSIAVTAEKDFLPYYQQTVAALSQFLELKEGEEELDLRAIALDTLGDLAEAVGADAARPYVPQLIKSSQEGLKLDYSRLKETSYMLWASLAKTYKEDFNTFLDGAVNNILEALAQDEDTELEVALGDQAPDLVGQEVMVAGRKLKVVDHDNVMDEDDDDSDDEWGDLTGFTDVAQEKEVALEALADIFSSTGKAYLPYYERTLTAVLPLLEHGYENTKMAAIGAIFRLYASLWKLQPDEQSEWQPGLPVSSHPTPELTKVRDLLMTKTMSEYGTEEDSSIVLEYNRNLFATLSECGPYLIASQGTVKSVVQVLVQLIGKKHPCQQLYEEDDDLDDADNSEDDWLLIESSLDVICGLATALGPQFAELWKIFDKSVLQFASGTSATERAGTVGFLAETIKGMKGGCSPYTTSFLKILMHRLSDEDTAVKSNAAFAVGMLVTHSEKQNEIKKAYPQILSKLEPLLRTDDPRQLDNAAGCVARLIAKHADSVPLGDVLPVLVGLLPLKEDHEENTPVWGMIVDLYKKGNETILGLTSQVVPALEKTLSDDPPDQLTNDTKEEVAQLVKFLISKQPNLLQQYPGLAKAEE